MKNSLRTPETLRHAARLMRERADAATARCWARWPGMDPLGKGGPFHVGTVGTGPLGTRGVVDLVARVDRDSDATHIASWPPSVAAAVADLLEQVARAMVGTSPGDVPFEDAAFAIAAAYLQGESE